MHYHLLPLAQQAAECIMRHYTEGCAVETKSDNSPVTLADLEANRLIVEALHNLTPDIPVVSEENPEEENRQAAKAARCWLVDPLDGTKSFIRRTGEFTVNIALVENGTPTQGIVYLPAQAIGYFTDENGAAYKWQAGQTTRIATRAVPVEGYVVVASLSHRTPETDAFIQRLPKVQKFSGAASSLKFCQVAEGVADIYPRFGPTMEWDTAAGHAVLLAAGGWVEMENGQPLRYGVAEDLRNPNFIAWGKRQTAI